MPPIAMSADIAAATNFPSPPTFFAPLVGLVCKLGPVGIAGSDSGASELAATVGKADSSVSELAAAVGAGVLLSPFVPMLVLMVGDAALSVLLDDTLALPPQLSSKLPIPFPESVKKHVPALSAMLSTCEHDSSA